NKLHIASVSDPKMDTVLDIDLYFLAVASEPGKNTAGLRVAVGILFCKRSYLINLRVALKIIHQGLAERLTRVVDHSIFKFQGIKSVFVGFWFGISTVFSIHCLIPFKSLLHLRLSLSRR